MIPRERAPFSAIVDRPKLTLPNGNRVIIWTIVNLEVWDISRPMPRVAMPPPSGQSSFPDVANWSWHEYGMRVGVWRFFELFERLGIRPTLSINARVCEEYERVAAQARDAGWEFMAHGYEQIPVVCPAKAGMFSRRKACRGKSQKPRSLDSRVAGNQDSEAYRQRLPRGDDEPPGRNESKRECGLENA